MDLFRVFSWDNRSQGDKVGGPFYVPRERQGAGRHDIPDLDGVLYCAHETVSAISEAIQIFRNQTLSDDDFERGDNLHQTLASYRLANEKELKDLNDPVVLKDLKIKPSEVATVNRSMTQALCRRLYEKGAHGFKWWSTLEASWINVTLFQSRIKNQLVLVDLKPLSTKMTEVKEASRWMKIVLG